MGPPVTDQGGVTVAINVTYSGPFFDGRAEADLARTCIDLRDQTAAQASSWLHYWMNRFFKWPTPYYETQVTLETTMQQAVIHDRGIVYGPWLAGTSLRNNASPFKGYNHWLNAVRDAEEDFPGIAQHVLAEHQEAWN